ncbi:MAG: lycopene cyclase domain-containing protein [Candidatus Omnitrophica bacterium]|nr:lycopene cyclase domain-containing protein [Candidatus Omnitrophota bacterium]
MSKYAITLFLSLLGPLCLSFYPPLGFYRNKRALIYAISSVLFIFGLWDIFATWRGHWFFDARGIYGIKIVNLPVEEWLFFVVIPFCCIFTWEALKYLSARKR